MSWRVAYTASQAEAKVATEARRLSVEAYMPVERFRRMVRGRRALVCRPLFPRYVFLDDTGNTDFYSIKGVSDVLHGVLSSAWVEGLRKAEAFGKFDRTGVGPRPFETGEHVLVTAGPFFGHEGIVARLKSATAHKRVEILLKALHQAISIELDVTDLDKVSSATVAPATISI